MSQETPEEAGGKTRRETREQQVARLIEGHVRDRNMDASSITTHYSMTHVGIELDPDFFEARLRMGWGFFKDEPRHLDHITRNMAISVFLAFRDRPGCYHQGKKAVMMGATYEQMMEAYEAGHVVGGGPVLMNGITALQRMMDEGVEPGSQEGPWRNHWVVFDSPSDTPSTRHEPRGAHQERINRSICEEYPDHQGGEEIREDLLYGARMDPEFFEGYARLAWEVYDDKRCYLDPVRRQMMALVILGFQGRHEEVYIHTRKALSLGARPEQLLELFEASFVGAGSAPLLSGIRALRRIDAEDA